MSVRIVIPGAWRLAQLDPGVAREFAQDYVVCVASMTGSSVRAVAVFNTSEADAVRVAALPAGERVPVSVRNKVRWQVRADGANSEDGGSASDAQGDSFGASRELHKPAKGCRMVLRVRSDAGDADAAIWFVRAEISLRTDGEITHDDGRNPHWRKLSYAHGALPPVPPSERSMQVPGGARWPADLHEDLGEVPERLGLKSFRHRHAAGGNDLDRPGTRYAAAVELRATVYPHTLPVRVYFVRFVPRFAFDRARRTGDYGGDDEITGMAESLLLARDERGAASSLARGVAERANDRGELFDLAAPGHTFAADGREGPSGVTAGASQVYLADFEDVLCIGAPDRLPRLWAMTLESDANARSSAQSDLGSLDYPGAFWAGKYLAVRASAVKRWYCSMEAIVDAGSYPEDGSGWRFWRVRMDADSRVGEGTFASTPIAQRHRGRVQQNVRESESYEVSLFTDEGAPVPNAAYIAVFPTGERFTGTLGADGKALIANAPSGEPEVYFPRYFTHERRTNRRARTSHGCLGHSQ